MDSETIPAGINECPMDVSCPFPDPSQEPLINTRFVTLSYIWGFIPLLDISAGSFNFWTFHNDS